jgi:hypothetical protein
MSQLKSLLRDRQAPVFMENRKDGAVDLHFPDELKTTRLRIIDGSGSTIKVSDWMAASRGGIPDWEKKYYAASSLIGMTNSRGMHAPIMSDHWDAGFFLGLMWGRFERKRDARVQVEEIPQTAEAMDAIAKRFQSRG